MGISKYMRSQAMEAGFSGDADEDIFGLGLHQVAADEA
jgi:hypothetical protein